MSTVFPLALDVFADQLGIISAPFRLEDNQELSGMGSGQILAADLAPSRWVADVQSKGLRASVALKMEALIGTLNGAVNAFYLYDSRKCGPLADPKGVALGSSAVKVNSRPDARSLTLKGLPAGYVLTAGDMLAVDYDTMPRRALFRTVEGVTADSTGVTGAFAVAPFVPAGVTADDAVFLIKPAAKMIIVPGSLDISSRGSLTTISFQATQKP